MPWWVPLLAPLALAAAAVAVTARGEHADTARSAAAKTPAPAMTTAATTTVEAAPVTAAVPTTTAAVAGVQVTKQRAAKRTARKTTTLAVGTLAAEHSVRVLDVVGPRIFWIGNNKATRKLVHVQGRGTRWAIRPGQRVTFTAVVARNKPGAARAWGLTRREGRDQLDRQGTHFEVYGPRIRFLCVLRCAR